MIYSGGRIRTVTAYMSATTRRTFLQASTLSAVAATRSSGANDSISAFDPAAEHFTDEAANRLAHPQYSAPYVIPNLAS
jgi:hypothetical protein